MPIDRWEIKYTDKWTGKEHVHVNKNNEADARHWAESLARDNGCKAECRQVNTDGTSKHVVSEGDKS